MCLDFGVLGMDFGAAVALRVLIRVYEPVCCRAAPAAPLAFGVKVLQDAGHQPRLLLLAPGIHQLGFIWAACSAPTDSTKNVGFAQPGTSGRGYGCSRPVRHCWVLCSGGGKDTFPPTPLQLGCLHTELTIVSFAVANYGAGGLSSALK